MAFTATSPMVVDLSGDNDNAGALAAASTIPSANPDSAFERSCDNPECSAPKLISLVPKRDTPEFITEPVIMNQPTLINGFTTVFQIDGIGAKMNDIMYGDQSGNSSTSNSPSNIPKSVFRIVPNTHAHIVNYVVVDGAGETMRKIKANDADTMRKLLDSQRLSAEQMLKKLIGKAFKAPARRTEPQAPAQVATKGAEFVTPDAPVAVTGPVPNSTPLTANLLPTVPPGITITPIPLPDAVQNGKAVSSVSGPTTQSPTTNAFASKSAVSQVSPSTTTAATPILRQALVTAPAATHRGPGRPPGVLKRKLVNSPLPDVIKRLRPRSPKQKTPMAVGLNPISPLPPQTKKLPTLPKLPTRPPSIVPIPIAQSPPQTKTIQETVSPVKSTMRLSKASEDDEETILEEIALSISKEEEVLSSKADTGTGTTSKVVAPSTQKPIPPVSIEESIPIPIKDTPSALPIKTKPLMGPASKINPLKAIAAAKNIAAKLEAANKLHAVLTAATMITRIGETVITSSAQTHKAGATLVPQTKPCSVSIPKVNVNLAINSPTPEGESSKQDDENSASTAKSAKTSTASTTVLKVVRESPPKDPLALDAFPTDATPTTPKPNVGTTPKLNETSSPKVNTSTGTKVNATKPDGPPGTRSSSALLLKPTASKTNAGSSPKVDEMLSTKLTRASNLKLDAQSSDKAVTTRKSDAANTVPVKTPTVSSSSKPEGQPIKVTRSSTPKITPTAKSVIATSKLAETTPPTGSATAVQRRMRRIVLPTRKSSPMSIPVRSPHPNLKISSVISGGSAVAAATLGAEAKSSTTKVVSSASEGPDIHKLQKELADLRRTVARLTKKKA